MRTIIPTVATVTTVATVALVSGCLLPPAAQLASMAMQGITLAATDKTVTDHGISIVAGRDCALWRGIKGQPVCDDANVDQMTGTALALNVDQRQSFQTAPTDIADDDPYVDAAAITAAATAPLIDLGETDELHAITGFPQPLEVEMVETDINDLDNFTTAAGPEVSQPIAHPPRLSAVAFVIGSFRGSARARVLADRHADLKAIVVRAQVKGRDAYRVVVGPVRGQERAQELARLVAAGLPRAWAIPYDPAAWAILPPGDAKSAKTANSNAVLAAVKWSGRWRL